MKMKPARNPSHIVFPKAGPASRQTEEMPRTQAELELAVAAKFLATIKHFNGIEYTGLRRGAEPSDVECDRADGEVVSVQIAEAIDQPLRVITKMRHDYLATLTERGPGLWAPFSGCDVVLCDTGDPPYLPETTSKKGRLCLGEMEAQVRTIGDRIRTLETGKMIRFDIILIHPQRTISLLITRHEAPSAPDRYQLSWGGGGPSYRTDRPRDIIPAAVRGKIKKSYSRPEGPFLLLVYSVDTLLMPNDPDLVESARLLSEAPESFDEAWYFHVPARHDIGHAVRFYPVEAAA